MAELAFMCTHRPYFIHSFISWRTFGYLSHELFHCQYEHVWAVCRHWVFISVRGTLGGKLLGYRGSPRHLYYLENSSSEQACFPQILPNLCSWLIFLVSAILVEWHGSCFSLPLHSWEPFWLDHLGDGVIYGPIPGHIHLMLSWPTEHQEPYSGRTEFKFHIRVIPRKGCCIH